MIPALISEVQAFLWALDLEMAARASQSDQEIDAGSPAVQLFELGRLSAQEALKAHFDGSPHEAPLMKLAWDLVNLEYASVYGTHPKAAVRASAHRLALISMSGELTPAREGSHNHGADG